MNSTSNNGKIQQTSKQLKESQKVDSIFMSEQVFRNNEHIIHKFL